VELLKKVRRTWYGPWAMNLVSNFSVKARYRRSSAERASSPTTAFIAITSLPCAYDAYSWFDTALIGEEVGGEKKKKKRERKRGGEIEN